MYNNSIAQLVANNYAVLCIYATNSKITDKSNNCFDSSFEN